MDPCLTAGCQDTCVVNNLPDGTLEAECQCNTGFELAADGLNCNDMDECALGTAMCNQVCSNTAGSYICSCRSGYQLALDGISCTDIDECTAGTENCQQVCNNELGTYSCSCHDGYTVDTTNPLNCVATAINIQPVYDVVFESFIGLEYGPLNAQFIALQSEICNQLTGTLMLTLDPTAQIVEIQCVI